MNNGTRRWRETSFHKTPRLKDIVSPAGGMALFGLIVGIGVLIMAYGITKGSWLWFFGGLPLFMAGSFGAVTLQHQIDIYNQGILQAGNSTYAEEEPAPERPKNVMLETEPGRVWNVLPGFREKELENLACFIWQGDASLTARSLAKAGVLTNKDDQRLSDLQNTFKRSGLGEMAGNSLKATNRAKLSVYQFLPPTLQQFYAK
jgi:hypothetical protein